MSALRTDVETTPSDVEQYLIEQAHHYRHDPLGFVLFCFEVELEDWQRDVLTSIGDQLKQQQLTDYAVIQEAISSGNGSGKSALMCWLIIWGMTTEVNTRGVITAVTETQLRTKTFAELAKWHNISKYKHWFTLSATSYVAKSKSYSQTWRMNAAPWSITNTEAFAGMHNKGLRILLLMDEASGIDDIIWNTAEGALTDQKTEIIWIACGNPTRNTGRFRDCFDKLSHRWHTTKVDTRNVKQTNKKQIQQWIDDHGIDSDFVKVRVLGEFPDQAVEQFIPGSLMINARERTNEVPYNTPKIFGVDVARFGDDASVIARLHGRKLEELHKFRKLDTHQLAAEVSKMINKYKPDAVFVDGVGVGGGVVDRLRALRHDVIEVNAGAKPSPDNVENYYNKRAEMYDLMKTWLETADIVDDDDLYNDAIGVQYYYDDKNRLRIEKKSEMKARGLPSPDCLDAVSMCFFSPVVTKLDEFADEQYQEDYYAEYDD